MEKITYDYLNKNGLILFETIVGSHAYGLNTPDSDTDYKFVYILPEDYILGTGYIEQLNVTKDITGWEIKRFLELMASNNPTVLELLNSPEDCVVKKHPLFDLILENKHKFITKVCKNSFGGYAIQQIKKAKGLNKKLNWESDKIIRKDILDFTYVIQGEKSTPWKSWNKNKGLEEKFCGIINVPNAKDVYALYFDTIGYNCFSDSVAIEIKENSKNFCEKMNIPMSLGYKGLVNTNENESNQLKLSSIPKGETSICNIIYNKDAYSQHCKDYNEYQEWLENRSEERYVETKSHGQKIDGKNMMHCIRLIRMAKEIGLGKGINVRRDDKEELLAIRRGEVDLENLIEIAEADIKNMDEIFERSFLPQSVETDLVNKLLIEIRKKFYK